MAASQEHGTLQGNVAHQSVIAALSFGALKIHIPAGSRLQLASLPLLWSVLNAP